VARLGHMATKRRHARRRHSAVRALTGIWPVNARATMAEHARTVA